MVVLPLLYQQAGWVTPTLGLLTMYILSSFAAVRTESFSICNFSIQLVQWTKL